MPRRWVDTDERAAFPEAAPPTLEAVDRQADDATRAVIRSALERVSGNVRLAALTLGIPRRTLDYRISALGLRSWLSKAYPRSARQPSR